MEKKMNKKIVSLSLLILVSSVIAEIPLRNNYNSKLRPFLYTAEVEWRKLHTNIATMNVGDQFTWYVGTGKSEKAPRGWQSLTSSNTNVISVSSSTTAEIVKGQSVYPSFTLKVNAPGTTVLKGVFNNAENTLRYTSFTVTIPQ